MSDSSDAEEPMIRESADDNHGSPNGENPSIPVSEHPSYMPVQMQKGGTQKPSPSGCRSKPFFGGCIQMPPIPSLGIDDIKNPEFGRMIAAEVLGTALLVFFGCCSVVTSAGVSPNPMTLDPKDNDHKYYMIYLGSVNPLHVAFAFGMVVATLAQALGHISGAHLNPAVSVGLMVAGKCSLLKTLFYIVAQCIGAVIGAGMVYLTSKHLHWENGDIKSYANPLNPTLQERYPVWPLGASSLPPGITLFNGFCTELLLTFLLVFTVVSVCDDLRKDIKGSAPLAIGIAVFMTHATGIRFTGASVNPARSLGPALFSSDPKCLEQLWIYWAGPLLGGIEAGLIYVVFFAEKRNSSSTTGKAQGGKSAA